VSEIASTDAEVRPTSPQTADEAFECNKGLIEQLREKHGEIEVVFQRGCGIVVVATPPRKEFRVFQDSIANEKISNTAAAEALAIASVVYPDREIVKAYFDKKPGLPTKIANLAQQLSGADADVLGKD
jgi:hypothetical protein